MQNTIKREYDTVIVGGGMTALIHDRAVLGGNASSEIRMHICGANSNMKKPELTEG